MDKRKIIKIYRKGRKNSIYYKMQCRYCNTCFDIMKCRFDEGLGNYCNNKCCNNDKIGKKRPNQSIFMKENNPMHNIESLKKHTISINTIECKEKKVKGLYNYYKNHPEGRIIRGIKTKQRLKNYPETHPMKQLGVKERHSKIMKQLYKDNPELPKKQGQSLKKFYDKYPEKHPNRILAKKGHRTKIERIMQEILIKLGLIENKDFKYNYRIKRFFADFALMKRKIVIECDGQYWHGTKEAQEHDLKRQKIIEKEGWTVIRFWENEIIQNTKKCQMVISKLI